jgi:hypothetical protein
MLDIDFLKGAVSAITAAAAAIFLVPRSYVGLQDTRMRLATKKRKKLDALLKDDAWRIASSLELQLAFLDAFGFVMDDRLLRFAFSRANAMQLIRDLRRCQLMVRLTRDGAGLEPVEERRRSFRKDGIRWFLAGFVPAVLCVFLMPVVAGHVPMTWIGAGFGAVFTLFPALGWIAGGLESAHRVTALCNELYPPDRAIGALAADPVPSGTAEA